MFAEEKDPDIELFNKYLDMSQGRAIGRDTSALECFISREYVFFCVSLPHPVLHSLVGCVLCCIYFL